MSKIEAFQQRTEALVAASVEVGGTLQSATNVSADPMRNLLTAAQEMLDAFGGDVPDWLRPSFGALESAVEDTRLVDGLKVPESRSPEEPVLVIGTREDRNTILAALRFYQQRGMGESANRSDVIHDVATNGEEEISYDSGDIDDLCERVNSALPGEVEARPWLARPAM